MTAIIRVAVVDDHPLFREGVVHLLETCPDIEVIAQGASAKEAIDIVQSHSPDVLVLDISIPGGGIAALQTIATGHGLTNVLILTVSADENDVLKALQLGAKGYVVKGVSGAELMQALRSVYNGDRYLSPSLGAKLLTDVGLVHSSTTSEVDAGGDLSCRENEILSFVGQGLSNKEIALKLNLSEKTVKHYMTNVFHKLHVRSRLEAALLIQKMPHRTSTPTKGSR